jgi:hypothetical protein
MLKKNNGTIFVPPTIEEILGKKVAVSTSVNHQALTTTLTTTGVALTTTTDRGRDRHKKTEARRLYMNNYMKQRRLLAKKYKA